MNLRQLEILRAVIRHRTTVAAADELALSQPAISNALKAMEAQAGFALFERVNNRLFPTSEAMALYKESEAIFALHAKLENRVRDLRECRSGFYRSWRRRRWPTALFHTLYRTSCAAVSRRVSSSMCGVTKESSTAFRAGSRSSALRSGCRIIPALPMRWFIPAKWSAS